MPSFSFMKKSQSTSTPDFFNRPSEKQRRLEGYKKVWEAYLAELPDPLVVDSAANDNVKVNPVRAIIEVGVYFLFGDEVLFEVAPNQSTQLGLKKPGQDMKSKAATPPKYPGADPEYDEQRETEKNDKFEADKAKRQEGYDEAEKRDQEAEKPKEKPDDADKAKSEGGDDKKFAKNKATGIGKAKPEAPETPEDPKYLVDLNRCWKANKKKAFLHKLGLSGALHGDVFVKMIPRGAGLKRDLPRLVLLDPANVDVETDPDDCERVIKYIITYNTEGDDGRPITREQEITPVTEDDEEGYPMDTAWEIRDYELRWTHDNALGWHPGQNGREQIGTTKKWEYPWPPIEHCNNMELPHMFWGLPDIDESSIDVVQSIQRTMSSLTKVVRVHGNPRMFAKGVMPELASEIDCSPDNIITLPAGAGVDSDLKILEALSNVSSFVEYIESMRSQLFEMLQCPPIALGQVDTMSMSMSGINLSILYAPLLQKTEMKRIAYGDLLDRLNHKLLVLMGHTNEEEYEDLTVVWPESMPGSHFLERQTLMEDTKLGVSSWTALQRLGYDPEREAQKKAEEMKAQQQMQFDFDSQQMELQSKLNPPNQAPGGGKAPDGGEKRGGNNNPSGFGNRSGSTGAQGNSTPKNKDNPSTSKSRGGPAR